MFLDNSFFVHIRNEEQPQDPKQDFEHQHFQSIMLLQLTERVTDAKFILTVILMMKCIELSIRFNKGVFVILKFILAIKLHPRFTLISKHL